MSHSNDGKTNGRAGSFMTSLAFLAFGVGILAFLVLIEHQNWFHIRPGSGSAAAMSQASDRARDVDRAGDRTARIVHRSDSDGL